MRTFMLNALESLRDRARKCVNLALKALLRLKHLDNPPSPLVDRLKEPVKPPKKAKKHVRKEKPRSNRRVPRRNNRRHDPK